MNSRYSPNCVFLGLSAWGFFSCLDACPIRVLSGCFVWLGDLLIRDLAPVFSCRFLVLTVWSEIVFFTDGDLHDLTAIAGVFSTSEIPVNKKLILKHLCRGIRGWSLNREQRSCGAASDSAMESCKSLTTMPPDTNSRQFALGFSLMKRRNVFVEFFW